MQDESDQPHPVFRDRGDEEANKVTFVELFFDLVFVFAVTQLSHALVAQFTFFGGLQVVLLLMAVWWVWINTSWATNWLDPETLPIRLMLFVLMGAGLVMSSVLPKAFGSGGLAFAITYVLIQVGRSAYTLYWMRAVPANYRNFQRLVTWFCLAAPFWLLGGIAEGPLRFWLWAIAIAIEYAGPSLRFYVPGLGQSDLSDWDVEGSHMAERCGLFIIIALGESILVTGSTYSHLEWSLANTAAFAVALVGSIAMWWLYFNIGAQRARSLISEANNPGRLAREAYTYLHLPLVAGIIVAAAADEFVINHPTDEMKLNYGVSILAAPALYLTGNLLFKRATTRRAPPSHITGLALVALCVPAAFFVSPLTLSALTTAILVAVAAWEAAALRHAPDESFKHDVRMEEEQAG